MESLSPNLSPPGVSKNGLIVKDLRVDYGAFTAVDGISFKIPPGEVFGLVGPNGAGKTSTIKVLATLLMPTYGEVSVFDIDILEQPDDVHEVLGYMPDLAPVIPDLRVWQFVDHFAAAYGWDKETRSARVEECLRLVDMWDSRDTFGKSLSRGMTQRVVLAKTLLPNPKILLLDEPASGMDPIARIKLKTILQDLGSKGVIVLISSHILTELADMCTSVGIMHKGHMRYVGPIEGVNESVENLKARVLQIDVLPENSEKLEAFLTNSSSIEDWKKLQARRYEISLGGGDEEQAQLLAEIVQAEVSVLNYIQKSNLESALTSLANES
ncbi:MAG: ABC transporter ATP-binding protein [Opitutales bacterium]|nr:ABC transporter ATP-binding protein [Opitutales bacterium]